MLTQDQALVVECIQEQKHELDHLQINIFLGCWQATSYKDIISAERDLLKLRSRGIIDFNDDFGCPIITDFGKSVFLQNRILQVMSTPLPDGNEYSDVKISKKLSDFGQYCDPSIIAHELDILQRSGFIDGLKHESQEGFQKRFINVGLTNKGRVALNEPDRVWLDDSKVNSNFTTNLINNIKAENVYASAIGTGSGSNIHSTLNIGPDTQKILSCIDSLKALFEGFPTEAPNQDEAMEVIDEIKDGVKLNDLKKMKFSYLALWGVCGSIWRNSQQGLEILNKIVDLGVKLKNIGIDIPTNLHLH